MFFLRLCKKRINRNRNIIYLSLCLTWSWLIWYKKWNQRSLVEGSISNPFPRSVLPWSLKCFYSLLRAWILGIIKFTCLCFFRRGKLGKNWQQQTSTVKIGHFIFLWENHTVAKCKWSPNTSWLKTCSIVLP